MKTTLPNIEAELQELKSSAAAFVELFAEVLAAEGTDPVLPPSKGREVRALFAGPLPRTGAPVEELLSELRQSYLPHLRRNGHPRFFGYVCASVDPLGALADALSSLTNQNVTAWRSAPAATEMERQVVRWLGEMVGFAEEADGLLVSGGSAANTTAVAVARRAGAARDDPSRACVYRSREGHLSFAKAFRLIGIPDDNVRTVSVDGERRMEPAALEAALSSDRERGLVPACVCASAGTANTGAIDPLDEIADVCERNEVWLHVDGAYGAPAALLDEYRWMRTGLARADSLSLDPHKWLFAPLDVGCVLFRDPERARHAFGMSSEYVTVTQTDPIERFAFFEHGLELSRRNRALKVWMILRARGLDRIAEVIGRNIDLRRHLDARVAADSALEPLGSELGIACFRYHPAGLDGEEELDAVNHSILEALVREGRFFLSPTTLEGRFALRVCIVNFRTAREDIDLLVDEVLRIGAALH